MTAALLSEFAPWLVGGVVLLIGGACIGKVMLRTIRRGAVAEDDAEEAAGNAETRSKVTDALGQRRRVDEWAARARERLRRRRESRRD